ncbi:MAG TPA: hypothetical protein VGP05_01555 [Pseudonocardia sp.]|nr:hypothetical protein [Pseudonocardia sp.]
MSSSNRRADLAARAAAVAGSSGARAPAGPRIESAAADPPGVEAGGGPVSSRVPRTRPVRVTVELSPMEHKALRQWCAQTSADLDLPVVAGAEVFRALLSLMRGDPEVADQVRAELERTGGSRRRH